MSRPTRPRLPPSSDSTFESFVLHVTSSSPFRDENSYSQDKKSTYFDLTPTTPSFSLPTIVSRTTVDRSPSRKFVASLSLLTFAVLALLPFLAQGDWSRSALTALDRKVSPQLVHTTLWEPIDKAHLFDQTTRLFALVHPLPLPRAYPHP